VRKFFWRDSCPPNPFILCNNKWIEIEQKDWVNTHEDAAKAAAQIIDQEDACLVEGDTRIIEIKEDKDLESTKWEVGGYVEPVYYARQFLGDE